MDWNQLLSAIGGGTGVAAVLFYFVKYLQDQLKAKDAIIATKDAQIITMSAAMQKVFEDQLTALKALHP